MITAKQKLASEKKIASLLGKCEIDVDFQGSDVLMCLDDVTNVMIKADGVWFDVSYYSSGTFDVEVAK